MKLSSSEDDDEEKNLGRARHCMEKRLRHTSRNEELETMGDLVQFLHQQLVIQQQKLSDSVELLKSGSLN